MARDRGDAMRLLHARELRPDGTVLLLAVVRRRWLLRLPRVGHLEPAERGAARAELGLPTR